jgi:hypothetical protein
VKAVKQSAEAKAVKQSADAKACATDGNTSRDDDSACEPKAMETEERLAPPVKPTADATPAALPKEPANIIALTPVAKISLSFNQLSSKESR